MTKAETTKTIEQRIEDAERKVERCEAAVDDAQADLDDAEGALEEAEAELEALEEEEEEEEEAPAKLAAEKIDAAFTTDRAGPMRPPGDRPIRTVCALSEIPPEFGKAMVDGSLHGVAGSGGDRWATNGHWMIRVDSIDGLPMIKAAPEQVIGARGPAVTRDDVPRKVGSIHARTFGNVATDLRYSSLIEDLFPGVEWHCAGTNLEPLHAVVDGALVAVVTPLRFAALDPIAPAVPS